MNIIYTKSNILRKRFNIKKTSNKKSRNLARVILKVAMSASFL